MFEPIALRLSHPILYHRPDDHVGRVWVHEFLLVDELASGRSLGPQGVQL